MQVKNCSLIKPLICKKSTPVDEVAIILRDNKQRRIIVVDAKGAPAGIISTTDLSNKVVAAGKDGLGLKASDVMTHPIFLIGGYEDDLAEIYKRMHEHQTFFVPVTKEGKLHGILTYGEIVHRIKEVIKDGSNP